MDLASLMDFDHVIEVLPDGTVRERGDIYAPELYDGVLESGTGWTLLTGYTGQYSYNGPVMHNSEYIGGRLASDILAEPGVYVALVNGTLENDTEPEGWAVARLDSTTDPTA